MSEPQFATHQDDDLPRTVRREKEARAQLARDILNAPRQAYGGAAGVASGLAHDADAAHGAYRDLPPPLAPGEYPEVTVASFNVPFFKLMMFFLKAVVAAIPALILLTMILWGMGQLAQKYMPWLIKMRILISFPG